MRNHALNNIVFEVLTSHMIRTQIRSLDISNSIKDSSQMPKFNQKFPLNSIPRHRDILNQDTLS